ncbi:MAG: dihydroorotate dehydrogenase [Candidatus Nanopelagicales bacterium]
MSCNFFDAKLPSPVFTASGCAASGKELSQFMDLTTIGGIVTKSVMLEARAGRATPRMSETPSGMLNGIGLQGPGIDAFLETDLTWLNEKKIATVVSIAGNTVEEFSKLAFKLKNRSDILAIEVNISCPNVENRNKVFACNPVTAQEAIKAVKKHISDIPLLAKLSPDVTDIVEIADASIKAGANGLSLINTLLGMVIDTKTFKPVLSGGTGGLSGPAIRPVAVRVIHQVRAAFEDIFILGSGGLRTGSDGLEFIAAGANALSLGTIIFNDPTSPVRIHNEMAEHLMALNKTSLAQVRNMAHD